MMTFKKRKLSSAARKIPTSVLRNPRIRVNFREYLYEGEGEGDDDRSGGWGAARHHRASRENPGDPVRLKS